MFKRAPIIVDLSILTSILKSVVVIQCLIFRIIECPSLLKCMFYFPIVLLAIYKYLFVGIVVIIIRSRAYFV